MIDQMELVLKAARLHIKQRQWRMPTTTRSLGTAATVQAPTASDRPAKPVAVNHQMEMT